LFDSGRIYEHSEEIATMLRQQQEKLTKYELRHVAQRDRIAILEMQHKQQQAEIEALKDKCLKLLDLMMIREGQPNKPSGDWWKGDATCGGLTENYGLRKAQEK